MADDKFYKQIEDITKKHYIPKMRQDLKKSLKLGAALRGEKPDPQMDSIVDRLTDEQVLAAYKPSHCGECGQELPREDVE